MSSKLSSVDLFFTKAKFLAKFSLILKFLVNINRVNTRHDAIKSLYSFHTIKTFNIYSKPQFNILV